MNIRRTPIVVSLRLTALFLLTLAFVHIFSAVIDLINNEYAIWQYLLIYLQLVVEALVFFQTFFMIFGMSSSLFAEYNELNKKIPKHYPTLDVYIPIREVNVDTLRKTIEGTINQDYPKDKLEIYIADDTPDKDLSTKYSSLANEYGINYIYDPTNKKYKSGMLNIALPKGNGEFIAFFDYDQIPTKGILKHMIEILQAYPDRAFVQTKKKFRNLYNLSRVWSALLYVQFFEVIEKTKMKQDISLFAGSTATFRRDVLREVGWMPEETFTEDNELSTKLFLNGHFGLFSDVYGSIGTVPDGFNAQVAQLWRWSHGGSHVLHKEATNLIRSKNLTWSQKLDHISLLAVTPSLVSIYLYVLTFIPLLLAGVDSPRYEILGISTLFFIPIGPAITYVIMITVAMWRVKKDNPELSFKQLPGFTIIALGSNILIMTSGILGILGLWGPDSKYGKWTRMLPIRIIAIFAFVVGIVFISSSIYWLMQGLGSAIILTMIGLSLIPSLPVVFYYDR